MAFGSTMCAISYFLMGRILLPHKFYVFFIAVVILGFGVCFAEIPAIPLFI